MAVAPGIGNPEIFFPLRGEAGVEAKRICARCPVKAECLQFALETDERWGVWGGTSAFERRWLRRELIERSVADWVMGQDVA